MTPLLRRSCAASFAVEISSAKVMFLIPCLSETCAGVSFRVMPMKPTLIPATYLIQVGWRRWRAALRFRTAGSTAHGSR